MHTTSIHDDDLNSDNNSEKSHTLPVISDNEEDSELEVNTYIIVGYSNVP